MFKIDPTINNNKIFYLKDEYKSEETFSYDLKIFNHISKNEINLNLVDTSPWCSGLTNNSTLITGSTTTFYSGSCNYLNSFPEKTFIFNNIIQISGVNYIFTDEENITETASCQLNGNYIISYNDNGAKIVVISSDGNVITYSIFSTNNIHNINIIGISTDKVVLGYYDSTVDMSYIQEISIIGTSILPFNPIMFFNGEAKQIKINKLSDIQFVITYQTNTKGIIQKVTLSSDHIFSVDYPFILNDDITLFSNSVYQNGNIVVIYYDLDDQLKIKNCRIYDDYIGIGLPKIIKNSYCYDLGIGILDNNYVYVSYYDGMNMVIYTSLVKIDGDDITIIDNATPIEDWNEGLNLTTIDNTKYMLSYTDKDFKGVYRYIDISGGTFVDIDGCDYNEFNIDISSLDYSKNLGHNDYWIYYNNETVEKGICYINQSYEFTYNI